MKLAYWKPPALITDIARIHNEGEEKSFKLLGVMLDEYLSFEAHVNNLCVKISKSLFCMNRIKNFVNPASMKMLYFAMVHSHLVYCINIYGCANKTTLNKLFLKVVTSEKIGGSGVMSTLGTWYGVW
jgi:hypothetical protein